MTKNNLLKKIKKISARAEVQKQSALDFYNLGLCSLREYQRAIENIEFDEAHETEELMAEFENSYILKREGL